MEHYAIIQLDEDTFLTVDWDWFKALAHDFAKAKAIMEKTGEEDSFLIPPEYREELWRAAQDIEIKPKKHPLQGRKR